MVIDISKAQIRFWFNELENPNTNFSYRESRHLYVLKFVKFETPYCIVDYKWARNYNDLIGQ